jgi:phenylpropionate dioxygenase-like ring-hydroxylating dioxygenase large terminal subunit
MRSDVDAGHIPHLVTDPERIPTKRYYDEQFYKLECERLWPRVWQMACRLEQIPNIGDYIEYTNLGMSVIVIRTKDGVRAYENACRHRGVKLAEGHGNCETQGFTCPFHGWRWNIEGENTFVYGRGKFTDRQLDRADLALPQVRLETWGGCAFINFDENAPSFRECFGPLAERLDRYQVDKLRAEWCYATVLPANWKVAMEAFMEGYHVMRTHPQLYEVTAGMFSAIYEADKGTMLPPVSAKATARENIAGYIRQLELLSEGMGGMCHAKDLAVAKSLADVELPDDPLEATMRWHGQVQDEVTRQGRARGEATPDLRALSATDPLGGVEFIFPHFFLLPSFSSFSAYRIRPMGPESCLFELWSLTQFPEGQEPEPVMEPVMLPYDSKQFPAIPQQDYENIPRQQLGLHAPRFEFMRLSAEVEGLISNYQRIIDGYLTGAAPEKLARATGQLMNNFDGPILDLGLE